MYLGTNKITVFRILYYSLHFSVRTACFGRSIIRDDTIHSVEIRPAISVVLALYYNLLKLLPMSGTYIQGP